MKITPILYTRPLSNGLYQVKIRIFDKGKTVYYTTGIEIEKSKWDEKLRKVKELKSFPRHVELNERLEFLISKFKGEPVLITKDGLLKNSTTTNQIFDLDLFLDFFRRQIDISVAQEKYTSYKKYKVVLKHLLSFKEHYPYLKKIDREFLDEFKIFLFKKGTIKQNGFYAYFKVFRTFIYKIIDTGHESFKSEYNPFLNYKMKEDPISKDKLSKEQLDKIISKNYDPNSPIGVAKYMFLFSFYSGGMRVADLLTLKWKNLIDGRLEYTMRKTKKKLSLPLNFRQLEILMLYSYDISKIKNAKSVLSSTALNFYTPKPIYNNSGIKLFGAPKQIQVKQNEIMKHPFMELLHLFRLKVPEEYIFPPLRGYKNQTKTELDKMISSKNAIYNDNLKKISLDCELGVKLSSHIARHTFSDLIRVSGAGLYEISKILGHSDIAVTQKYLKSFDQGAVDDAVNEFYGKNY